MIDAGADNERRKGMRERRREIEGREEGKGMGGKRERKKEIEGKGREGKGREEKRKEKKYSKIISRIKEDSTTKISLVIIKKSKGKSEGSDNNRTIIKSTTKNSRIIPKNDISESVSIIKNTTSIINISMQNSSSTTIKLGIIIFK